MSIFEMLKYTDRIDPMNIEAWLGNNMARLKEAGIITARLDCLILLEDATGKDRGWLLAHPEFIVNNPSFHILEEQVRRRSIHEPIAYIRGKSEFYGREFIVNPDTLQPRPETETMIDLLKELVYSRQLTADSQLTIIDVGTGSGCLAITVKSEFPMAKVYATDISPKCIKIAKQNAKKNKADIDFYHGDLLTPIPSSTFHLLPSILLANLPYVPDEHLINEAAMFEPKLALFGGPDGLNLYRRLFLQISKLSQKPGYVFTEALPLQHKELKIIAKLAGYKIHKIEDFIQVFNYN